MPKHLSVIDQHQERIALATLRMSDTGAKLMGGMDKEQARKTLLILGYTASRIAKIEALADQPRRARRTSP